MKSLTQFLEAQNFLIKGHTKDQSIYVDLDLPSGTKWATCNIGADKPEDPGLLFQWGRTDGYKYDDKKHKFLSKKDYVTTSGTEYKKGSTLKPEDDAAQQATKGRFRMPTKDEIDELLNHTNNESAELNGVKGRKFISKEDNSKWIFIPAAGCFYNNSDSFYDGGSRGYIWTSSCGSLTKRYEIEFDSFYCYNDNTSRGFGFSVRGVLNKRYN